MTWLHCDVRDGSVVSCSSDEDFTEANASHEMKSQFVNIHTDIPIDKARLYKKPLFDSNGNFVKKRQWFVDLRAVVPVEHRGKIADREQEIPLIKTSIAAEEITKVRTLDGR